VAYPPLQNGVLSLVASAPSPATSGTTLTVTTGDGAGWGDPDVIGAYPVTLWPDGQLPVMVGAGANAEVALVTGKSTDTLTIIRAQEGTTARTVTVGWRVAATLTVASLAGRDALTNLALVLTGVR
jgi:hypothetical protein